MPGLPRPTRREYEFPGIKVAARLAAGSEPGAGPGHGQGWKEALDASRGRWPRLEQVVQRLRSRPHCSNFPAAWQANERCRESEGIGEGKGRTPLLVPCASAERRCAAPRALFSAGSAPTGRLLRCWPPPRLAAGAKAHQRRASRSRVPLGRPLGAGCWLAATSGARAALQTSRGSALPHSMPGPGLSAPPHPAQSPAQSPAAVGRILSLSIGPQPAPGSPEPLPPLKCAINFPSLPPPRSAPATQTPPPDAPSLTSRLSQPPPARPRLCRSAPPPHNEKGRQYPCTPSHTPRTRADPRERSGAWPGAQGMNISVLAKLPSTDVMAPAAVTT